MDSNEDFERQLLLEAREIAEKSSNKVYTGPKDGTIYEWDSNKKAWFPKIDDIFIAKFQEYYQFKEDAAQDASTSQEKDKGVAEVNSLKRKTPDDKPGWFEVADEHNTKVYINNLPMDSTEEEFEELMKKCGLIMKDDNNKLKLKLYKDSNGYLKGDGLCDYIKVESVHLALQILDGYNFKGNIIAVERAKFTLKGEYDPSKKPRKKKNKDKEKMKKKMDKLFDWRPEKMPGERPVYEKCAVIENFFDIKEFDNDPKLILEYRNDVRDECQAKCGEVKKVVIYDRNTDGIVCVYFKEFEAADHCVTLMNGRFFAGRQLKCHLWDGKTKYRIDESEEELQRRIDQWNMFLEEEDT